MNDVFAAGIVAFGTAVIVTALAEAWSRRRRLFDEPNERSSHSVPTPRVGGLGIAAGVLCGITFVAAPMEPTLGVVTLASLALGAVGLMDDVRRTSVLAKYLAQLGAALAVAIAVQPTLHVDLLGWRADLDGAAAMVLVTVWLTAIANAINFMDGSDGLIGSLSVAMALAGIWLVTPGAGALLLVVAASALGFLVWNHAPASIFMGDVGSQFLGLLIGGTLLLQLEHRVAVVPVVLLMSPLLFDTGYTLLWRARAGRNLFAAHREHLYQRLISSGVSHRAVAAGYALAVGVAGVIAHGWDRLPAAGQAATIVAGAVLGAAYVLWVRSVERASMGGRGGAGRGA